MKIVTLAIAFACSALILLFSLNEFGFDRFHHEHHSVVRILQKNNSESYSGNRLSNKIPFEVFAALNATASDSLIVARVKVMDKLNVRAGDQFFSDLKFHAADPQISNIFSFEVLDGSLKLFHQKKQTLILSSSASAKYFGTSYSAGKQLKIFTLRDTLLFTVAAVYKDYPQNSHEEFNAFVRFDSLSIQSLHFNPGEAGIYGKLNKGSQSHYENKMNHLRPSNQLTYTLQSISDIYFGPRVMGEDARHGDHYSIVILIFISVLILSLAVTSFVNLTTLTLPYRSKELAIKKLAGTSQSNLTVNFAKESLLVTGISLVLGVLLLAFSTTWIKSILLVDMVSLFLQADAILIFAGFFIVVAVAPLVMTLRFTRATPNRLLSAETITFPRFKRTIIFLQLGISIFLIAASMVIKRQINYSLLKEPGRNYDQVVYVSYPEDLTGEGLVRLRDAWRKNNANIVDVMATSQLPDRISSKELNSEFFTMSVDRGFKDFFDVEMIQGNWFKANDGDSILVINEQGKRIEGGNTGNIIGVFRDLSSQFNQPEKPVKINVAAYFSYNFLCIRVLEVDIRRTVRFLENYFAKGQQKASVFFFDKRFEEWLLYQDKLNMLSEVLAIISALLSCCAIYGLSVSIVRDKLKQIAIHKLCGANTLNIIRILLRDFVRQMLMAILIFGPLTYIILKEMLRGFVYSTHFTWLDPLLPLGYCFVIITLLCGLQTLNLNREDLSGALKG